MPRTSGRTPDVQLRARDATLCIIGHLVPNLGECPDVFLLLQVKYFSDILRTSSRTPDVRLCAMATVFLHYRTTCAQLGRAVRCFPFLLRFKYFSDILRMSGRAPDVRICAMAAVFLYYRTTRAQLGRVFRCFSFHNISPFLLPDLFSLLPCLSN